MRTKGITNEDPRKGQVPVNKGKKDPVTDKVLKRRAEGWNKHRDYTMSEEQYKKKYGVSARMEPVACFSANKKLVVKARKMFTRNQRRIAADNAARWVLAHPKEAIADTAFDYERKVVFIKPPSDNFSISESLKKAIAEKYPRNARRKVYHNLLVWMLNNPDAAKVRK